MYLNSVAPKHEFPDDEAADAAGGADDEHGGVLGAGDGKFAHGPTLPYEQRRLVVVRPRSPRNLPQPGEFPPHLVEYLPRSPPQPHRIHLVQPGFDRRD